MGKCEYNGEKVTCERMGEGLKGGRVYAIAVKNSKKVYATGSFADTLTGINFIAR